jgi:hypothetical protein
MNPLILRKKCRRETNGFERSLDLQLLTQVKERCKAAQERCKAAQERLAHTLHGPVSTQDDIWALVYEDLPALLNNLEGPR